MHKPKKQTKMEAISCQCPAHFLRKRNIDFIFADTGFFIFSWMFLLQVLPTDSGLQMAKGSRLSDYKIKCIPLGKPRVLFKFYFLMKEVKEVLMSHYIYFREIFILTIHIPSEINLTKHSQCNSAFCQRLLKYLVPSMSGGNGLVRLLIYWFAPLSFLPQEIPEHQNQNQTTKKPHLEVFQLS